MDIKALRSDLRQRAGFCEEMRWNFFEAMKQGYAATPAKGTIPELPGSKTIRYVNGLWTIVDLYFVSSHSSKSHGTTLISHNDDPVWMMQYHGEYSDETLPFLKTALLKNYDSSTFLGGRGPKQFDNGNLLYRNICTRDDLRDFSRFEGHEEIRTMIGNHQKGWHSYHGGLLF